MSEKAQKPIVIFRGDNTAAFDLRTITILLTGDLDLTNATARFDLLGFTKSWTTEEVATGELSIVFDSAQTKAFALGPQTGTLRLFDMSTGTPRQLTVVNKIPFFVTNNVCEIDSQSYGVNVSVSGGDVIRVEFKVGAGAVEGKADKVKNATAGDLASLTADGNLEDSGIPKTDVLRKSQMDATPTAGSQNPVTSDGIKQAIDAATPSDYAQVKAQVEQNTRDIATNTENISKNAGDIADNARDIAANTGDISAIEAKIPAQASAQNQLADKAFVNSSIATNTATFRGSYNLVSDLGLTVSATEQQVAAAIAAKLSSLVPPVVPENNDYCFVQVPKTDADPTVIERVDRYKCTVTESGGVTTRVWEYEWSLNNSSFTADQWAAINSGITSGDVAKLVNLPTAEEIAAKGYVLFDPSNGGSDKNHFNATSHALLVRTVTSVNPVSALDTGVCKGILISPANYMAKALGQDTITTPVVPGDPLYDFITASNRALLTSVTVYLRVGSVNTDAIRLLIKSADGETTLATSSYASATSLSTFQPYVFSFADSDVWLDAGTQYRFEFEYSDLDDYYLAAKPLYPTLKENAVYTFDNNAGVKWSLITEDNGAETVTEVSDKCVNMGMGGTVDVTVTIPVANLLDIGYYGFSPLKKYALNEKCVKDGILYECKNSSGHGPAPWSSNNFRAVLRLDDNITIGKGSTVYGPSTQLKNNIVVGLNTASAAGTNNIVVGYSAKARCTEIGSPTGSDDTSGNVVIGFSAAADNANNTRYAPMDSVVVGKYAKMHGSYGIVLGVAAEVTEDKGVAIGTEALAKGEASAAIGYQASADPDFVNTKAYEVDDIVVQGSYAYKCILAVSAATSLSPNPSPPQDGTHWQLLDGVTISTARSLAVGNDARTTGEGAVAIGSGARAKEDNSVVIGAGAVSHGTNTTNFKTDELSKVFLGSNNIVDLINAAVNAAIQNATIPAAVSTTTATGGGRRLLAAATPTSTTKTEVTPSDIGALGNSGNQTLNGNLTANNIDAQRVELYDNGLDAIGLAGNGLRNPNNDNVVIRWPALGSSDTLALVSQVYAAVQQIAPDFTAKAYVLNEPCSYNGVVYRCKSAYTATASSAKPSSDTTHWEAKKVSELFLPLTGGTMTGGLKFKAPNAYLDDWEILNNAYYGFSLYNIGDNAIIKFPSSSINSTSTLALLENIAPAFSTSATYALNQLCVYSNKLYRCTTAITTAEAWTAAHWTEATVEDVLAAIRSALNDKAPLASPAFTGTPTAPNMDAQSADGQVANKKYVDDKVAGVSVMPLSGQTFDFATMQGIFAGVKACIEALGGSVTNFPAIPANE